MISWQAIPKTKGDSEKKQAELSAYLCLLVKEPKQKTHIWIMFNVGKTMP